MSELKSQIDYSKLEWFDCESNFPPMHIDLYVDSEHGFGIGRLGKRVKDGSTIWTVHLDSGEVYLVYAFYKVKRWAYMEEEKTNTKLKHELKATTAQEIVRNEKDCDYMDELFGGVKMPPTQVYLKSEADAVIADLIEKNKRLANKDIIMASEAIKEVYKELRHQKYKRCLLMAKRCKDKIETQAQYDDHDDWLIINEYWERWRKRWLKIAEKFNDKEAK